MNNWLKFPSTDTGKTRVWVLPVIGLAVLETNDYEHSKILLPGGNEIGVKALPKDVMAAFDEQFTPLQPEDQGDLEERVSALEHAIADLHAALSDNPSPVTVQKAVADIEVPQPQERAEAENHE